MTTLSLSTPPNTSVNSYIIHGFLDRWIGRGGSQYWPPRPPELNPLDFHLCRHMNDTTYTKSVKAIRITPSQFGDRNHTDVIPKDLLRDAHSIYSLTRCDGDQSEYLM